MKITIVLSILALPFWSATSVRAVTIDWVTVGNAGNAADPETGHGAVSHAYRIGTYEVTNAQYAEFLNAVDPTGANVRSLYNTNMSSHVHGGITFDALALNSSKYQVKSARGQVPVVFVSFFDAMRFSNWLQNGQGSGDTETGAYTIYPDYAVRGAGSKVWIPTEDEWYKAAYHKNDGVTANYFDYPTSSNVKPASAAPNSVNAPDIANTANYWNDDGISNGYNDGFALTGVNFYVSSQYYLNNVGSYSLAASPYGTFDQGGNVFEWCEERIDSIFRVDRGGSWRSGSFANELHVSYGGHIIAPTIESDLNGFRVASVPEPSAVHLASLACLAFSMRLRHRQSRAAR